MKTISTKKRRFPFSGKMLSAISAFALLCFQGNAQTTFNYTGALQTYTVPTGVTLIRIDASGAQGGSVSTTCAATGGMGAHMVGDFTVTPGEVISILVGQQGLTNGSDAGGGGGSYVVRTGNIPLVVAGGGGGATNNIGSCGANRNGINATITTSGTASANGLVAGGTGGNGGGASSGSGGGGGGFYTDGTAGTGLPNNNGKCYLNGGAGGTGNNVDFGGYGGGGAGWFTGGNGGGGGGYSGGGTSGSMPYSGGGGGGSYNAGTNQSNTAGFQAGNGRVIITVLYSATIAQTTAISCNGGNNGSLTVTPSGGTSPYTYSWAPSGGTAATASGLSAGTYTVTVTDANMATTTQTFTLTQPTAITASQMQTNVSCNGGNNGNAMVMVSGGTPGYTYSWSPSGGTGSSASSLVAGAYTCTITDANGCTAASTFNITEPTAITQVIGFSDVTCNAACNGSAMSTPTGGTAPYTYAWSPSGGTGAMASGLCAGTYTCTVTDANGCVSTGTTIINEPTALSVGSTVNNVLCNGGNTGDATANVSGGTAPYSYSWSSGGLAATESNLVAGSYTCNITDANGCTSSVVVTITEPAAINVTVSSTDVSCNGGNNGAIDITPTGGTMPYTFDWNGGMYTTEDLTGLTAGTYTGTITDANGCINSGTVVINEPTAITATSITTDATTCGGSDGAINLTVGGGTPAYTYLWDNSATTEDLIGITAGTYICTITDASGCTSMATVTVNDPAPPSVGLTLSVSTICADDASITLSGGTPSGGTYSGPGVTGTTFDPSSSIIGANTITYTYTDPNTNCSASATSVINVSACTGISTFSNENLFTLMPNPNNGTFTLMLNTTTASDVMIYNSIGQLVTSMKVQPAVQQQMNIEVSGVYSVMVISADGSRSTQRIVVNR